MRNQIVSLSHFISHCFLLLADSAKGWKRIPGDEKSRPARRYTPGQWRQANRFSTGRQGGPDVGNTGGGGQRRTGSNFSGPTGTSNRQTGNVRGTGKSSLIHSFTQYWRLECCWDRHGLKLKVSKEAELINMESSEIFSMRYNKPSCWYDLLDIASLLLKMN